MAGKPLKKTHLQSASVPDISHYDNYVSRTIDGMSEFEIFDFARQSKDNVLVEGPTGPGKTMAFRAYAAREQMRFYAVPSNIGIEPSQLFGKYIPDGTGGFVWQDGPVSVIARHGGVLLINEVNFMPERVATVLFGLLDARRQITLLDHKAEVIEAGDKDILIAADMNPDYEGTRPLNKAFRNRFAIQLWWDYDPEVERQLIKSGSLRDTAKAIRDATARGEYETPTSTNMLMEFERIALATSLDFAITNFVNHFNADERGAVRLVMETDKDNIDQDLTAIQQEELESQFPPEDPIWAQRDNAPEGWQDPEWGIKGIDWTFSED
jgi:MoxR-like ATPase